MAPPWAAGLQRGLSAASLPTHANVLQRSLRNARRILTFRAISSAVVAAPVSAMVPSSPSSRFEPSVLGSLSSGSDDDDEQRRHAEAEEALRIIGGSEESDDGIDPASGAAKQSLSTLENHTVPPFYACYLLRSKKNGKFSRRTYVGST